MKSVIFVVMIVSFLAGCRGDAEIDTVKESVMDFDRTTTLGKALDNWKSCQSSRWDVFDADNGIKIIEFSCTHKIEPMVKKIKSLLPERNSNSKALNIVSYTEVFQFTFNPNDSFNSLRLNNVESVYVWSDGSSFSNSKNKPTEGVALGDAYRNELKFDPETLNARNAYETFKILKSRSK